MGDRATLAAIAAARNAAAAAENILFGAGGQSAAPTPLEGAAGAAPAAGAGQADGAGNIAPKDTEAHADTPAATAAAS